MDKVIVKKVSDSTYEIIQMPHIVEIETWRDVFCVGELKNAKYFHCSWLEKIKESCLKNRVELEVL